jgi:hypothetical protein
MIDIFLCRPTKLFKDFIVVLTPSSSLQCYDEESITLEKIFRQPIG